MANAALSTATFITPAAHGDLFISAPVLVVISHLHRLAGVPERAVPCRDRTHGAARDTVQAGLSDPVAPVGYGSVRSGDPGCGHETAVPPSSARRRRPPELRWPSCRSRQCSCRTASG